MKKILTCTLLVVSVITLAACNDNSIDTNKNELTNGYFEVTGNNSNVSLSINVVDNKINTVLPISYDESETDFNNAWKLDKEKIEDLDYSGLENIISDDTLSDYISDSLKELLSTKEEDIIYDLDLYNTVEDLENKYGKIISSSDTGYYSGTTYNEVETNVDTSEYLNNEVIAIQIGSQRATVIKDLEGYDDGFYLMTTGPQRLSYREFITASDIKMIIGVDSEVSIPAPETNNIYSSLTNIDNILTDINKISVTSIEDENGNDIKGQDYSNLQVTAIYIDGATAIPTFVWSGGKYINMMTQLEITENDLSHASSIRLSAYTNALPNNSITAVNNFLTSSSRENGLGLTNVIFVQDSNTPSDVIDDIESFITDNPTYTISAIYPSVPKSGMPAIWNADSWFGLNVDLMTNANNIMVVVAE